MIQTIKVATWATQSVDSDFATCRHSEVGVKVGLFSSRAVTWETPLLWGGGGGQVLFLASTKLADISALIVCDNYLYYTQWRRWAQNNTQRHKKQHWSLPKLPKQSGRNSNYSQNFVERLWWSLSVVLFSVFFAPDLLDNTD